MNNSMRSVISQQAPAPHLVKVPVARKFTVVDPAQPKLQPNLRPIGVIQNDLLAALSTDELALLLPHAELVHLESGQELYAYGDKIREVFFPTTAVIGLLYILANGESTEIGVTGHEGLLGVSVLMSETSLGIAKVQCAGYAYKLKASILKDVCSRTVQLQALLMRYTHALFSQIAQNSVCGRHYSIDRQLSRWILDRLDRLSGKEVKVTQEMIANMLGVRRESVTDAAGRLQSKGFIQCRRGVIVVDNRRGLEQHAGECYKVAKREFDSVLSSAIN